MGGRGHIVRLVSTVFFALVLAAGLAVFAAGLSPHRAEAFVPPKDEHGIIKELAEETRLADEARARGEVPAPEIEEKQAKARRIITKSARSAYLKPVAGKGAPITPHLMRAGLVGVAAGLVVHDAILIKNGIECGQAHCPPPIVLEVEFAKAAAMETGLMVTRDGYSSTGPVRGAILITSLEWDYSPSTKTAVPRLAYAKQGEAQIGNVSWRVTYGGCENWNYTVAGPDARSLAGEEGGSWAGGPMPTYEAYNPKGHLCVEVYQGPVTEGRASKKRVLTGPAGAGYQWENPVFEIGAVKARELPTDYEPEPGEYVPSEEQNRRLIEAIKADPEFDLDRDGLLNRDDEDDDGDGVDDSEDPAPYDPYDPKPWLSEGFRAPTSSAEREALWGPVIGEWTTPGGGQCYEYESGAKLCDYPGGSTFVWIVEDYTVWMQHSDGDKESRVTPADRPSSGSSSEPTWGKGDKQEIPEDAIPIIAQHAITEAIEGETDHIIEGLATAETLEEPSTETAYEMYIEAVSNSGIKPHEWSDGTKMFYDPGKDAVIIYNPNASNKGSVYVPTDPNTGKKRGGAYYLEVTQRDRPPTY